MAQILDKTGLQHYATKMCNADNRKVGSKSLPTVLNEIDTKIDGFKSLFDSEYGTPLESEINNKTNSFKVGKGINLDKSIDVENSFTELKINGHTMANIMLDSGDMSKFKSGQDIQNDKIWGSFTRGNTEYVSNGLKRSGAVSDDSEDRYLRSIASGYGKGLFKQNRTYVVRMELSVDPRFYNGTNYEFLRCFYGTSKVFISGKIADIDNGVFIGIGTTENIPESEAQHDFISLDNRCPLGENWWIIFKKIQIFDVTNLPNECKQKDYYKNISFFNGLSSIGQRENQNHKLDIVSHIAERNLIKEGKGINKNGFFKYFDVVEKGYGEHTLTSQKTYTNVSLLPGFTLDVRDYEIGKQVTFSYELMFTKWNFPEGTNRAEFWIGQRYTNSTTGVTDGQWRGVTQHGLPVVGENGCELNKWVKVSKTFTIPTPAHPSIGSTACVQFYNSNPDISASVTFRIKNVKLEYNTKASEYTPMPGDADFSSFKDKDKKEIILAAPLRSIPNGVKDTIEKINGEWKIIRRCKEIILNGSENWLVNSPWSSGNYLSQYIKIADKGGDRLSLLCDRFVVANQKTNSSNQINNESCFGEVGNGVLYVNIIKSKLTTSDMSGFKKWLQANPTKVIYELVTPIIEDIDPITLQCWKNGTISIEDEVLPIETTHTVALNKSAQIQKNIEELTTLRNKVKALEKIYNSTTLEQAFELELLRSNIELDKIK